MTRSPMRSQIVVSCEHGGHGVPSEYTKLFAAHARLLETHRGWDPGALELAHELAKAFRVRPFVCTTTRLLVDTNRSLGHPRLFSNVSRELSASDRARVLARFYTPYRARVRRTVLALLGRSERLVHLSAHSFTPVLAGVRRQTDVGLLYDSTRPEERRLCLAVQRYLAGQEARLRVRRNYPYRGSADGFVTELRRELPSRRYLGIEIELSQRYRGGPRAKKLRALIARAFFHVLANESSG